MQIGDIINDYSGEHQISVTADRFIVVDWTTVQGNSFENTMIGGIGCCASIGILILGAILALTLKDEHSVIINQNQQFVSPTFMRDGKLTQSGSSENEEENWWEEE